ncbi:glycosyl transferase group 1 [Dokdonia sp. 4H-3-7-5]|nr:glycosyl transferase group 1 [Dokdonia sp. 4H-3-7-5]
MMAPLKKVLKRMIGYINLSLFYVLVLPKIKKSDIVFIFPYYHMGGAEQVHLDIVKSIADKKVTVIFTHLSATDHFLSRFRESATVIELNSIINKKSKHVRTALFNTIATAINKSTTVTHVFGCNTNYFYDILPLIDKRKRRLDLIHAIAPDDSRIDILATSAQYIDTRVVINEKAKNDIYRIYSDNEVLQSLDHITVIANGVILPASTDVTLKNWSKDIINVGFIGRWSEEKRPELYLKIAHKAQKKGLDAQFYIAGSGMKAHKEVINKASVLSLDEISNKQDLQDFYKKLHFVIICSKTEGFPMVLMESMPYGVVPLCTNVGGISEHIHHGEIGVLVENSADEDVIIESFLDNINALVNDIPRVELLSKKAQEYAVEHFGITKFQESYKNLFV